MSTVLSREGRGSLCERSHLDPSRPWGVGFLQGPEAGVPLCGGGYMGWTKRGTYCLPRAMHFLYMPFAGLRKLSAISSVLCVLSPKMFDFLKYLFCTFSDYHVVFVGSFVCLFILFLAALHLLCRT